MTVTQEHDNSYVSNNRNIKLPLIEKDFSHNPDERLINPMKEGHQGYEF